MTTPPEESQERVKQAVEEAVAKIKTPAAADTVVDQLERISKGHTEGEKGDQAAAQPAPAAENIEDASNSVPPATGPAVNVAQTLVQTAAEAVAPTPEAADVLKGADEVLTNSAKPIAPSAEKGRDLLKQAVVRKSSPWHAADIRAYLAINGLPHTRELDVVADTVTILLRGGWIWVGGVLLSKAFGAKKTGRALQLLIPAMAGATLIVEHPIKQHFRRERPFIDIVRALVVGKKPGSWSFPSGHSASSFAAARVLSSVWPKQSRIFLALASMVGFSRIYVGAHYPSDVLSGAVLGSVLAEIIRRAVILIRPK